MTKATEIKCMVLAVLPVALAAVAAPANAGQGPNPPRKPDVATPECRNPKPYDIESWRPVLNSFTVSIASATLDSAYLEFKRLAGKHGFAEAGGGIDRGGKWEFWVEWLEPDQVAALRCEASVAGIGFIKVLAPNRPVAYPGN